MVLPAHASKMLLYLTIALKWLSRWLGLFSRPSPLSSSQREETIEKALNILTLFQSRRYEEVLKQSTLAVRLLLSPELLGKVAEDLKSKNGDILSFSPIDVEASATLAFGITRTTKILVKFERAELVAVITFNYEGLIAGLRFKPPEADSATWKAPSYANSEMFLEEEVTLSASGITVGATLSIPKTDIVAGVVFLAGSGPTDRDSTIGPNKPLKDLAWGLASQGVAVCRWDKPSGGNIVNPNEITLEKEYIPYALTAVTKLSEQLPKETPIYVLGHSLGATVAPILAEKLPNIKGLLLLSAGAQKLHHSALRQLRYLFSLNHNPPYVTEEYITIFEQQVAIIDSPGFNTSFPSDQLPFGAPASYWLSIKGYNQVATTVQLNRPTLLLQGGRDYQITKADDFCVWVKETWGMTDIELEVCDELNHLLIKGEGMSNPDEYLVEGHVDENALMKVMAWIRRHSN